MIRSSCIGITSHKHELGRSIICSSHIIERSSAQILDTNCRKDRARISVDQTKGFALQSTSVITENQTRRLHLTFALPRRNHVIIMCTFLWIFAIHTTVANQLLAIDVENILALGIFEFHQYREEIPLIHQSADGHQNSVFDFQQRHHNHVEQFGFDIRNFINICIVSTLAAKSLCKTQNKTNSDRKQVSEYKH